MSVNGCGLHAERLEEGIVCTNRLSSGSSIFFDDVSFLVVVVVIIAMFLKFSASADCLQFLIQAFKVGLRLLQVEVIAFQLNLLRV